MCSESIRESQRVDPLLNPADALTKFSHKRLGMYNTGIIYKHKVGLPLLHWDPGSCRSEDKGTAWGKLWFVKDPVFSDNLRLHLPKPCFELELPQEPWYFNSERIIKTRQTQRGVVSRHRSSCCSSGVHSLRRAPGACGHAEESGAGALGPRKTREVI